MIEDTPKKYILQIDLKTQDLESGETFNRAGITVTLDSDEAMWATYRKIMKAIDREM